jgi:hypothetical protein
VRRRIVRGCLIGVSLLAGALVPAASALAATPSKAPVGGIGVRLVAARGSSHASGLARAYMVEHLAPGTSVRRRLEISNTTHSVVDVLVYPAGASVQRGEFAFASGHDRNQLSSWTTVSRDTLRLAPGGTAFETVTIEVPKEGSRGEQYAVVWAQVSAPAPATGGITVVNRVGIRMYVSVGPGGAPPASFTIGPLAAQRSPSGDPLVVATIRNSGRRTLDISGSLTLSGGPGGLRAGPVPVTLGMPLAPGASELATVHLDRRVPRGPWHARIHLTSGALQRTAVATLTFPRARAVAGSGHHTSTIVIILLIVLAIAGVVLLLTRLVLQARRRELKRPGSGDARPIGG